MLRLQRTVFVGKVCPNFRPPGAFLKRTFLAASIPRPGDLARQQTHHLLWPAWVQRRLWAPRYRVRVHGILGALSRVETRCVRAGRVGALVNSAPTGKMGTQVIVPYREEDEARLFKPMGDLGQIVRMVRRCFCFSRVLVWPVLISGVRYRSGTCAMRIWWLSA